MIKTWLLAGDGSVASNVTAIVPIVVGVLAVCFIIGMVKGAKNKKKAKRERSKTYHSIWNCKVTLIDNEDKQWEDKGNLYVRTMPVALFTGGIEETLLIEKQMLSKDKLLCGSEYCICLKSEFANDVYDNDKYGEPIINKMKFDVNMAFVDRYYTEITPPCESSTRNIKDLVLQNKFVCTDNWHDNGKEKNGSMDKMFSAGHFEDGGNLYYVTHNVQLKYDTGEIYKDYNIYRVKDGETIRESLFLCNDEETADFITKYKLYDLR